MCRYVLVGYAVICAAYAVGFKNLNRSLLCACYRGADDVRGGIYGICREFNILSGRAIYLCGLFNHIYVFFVSHAGDTSVVFHSDKQTAAFTIGESGDRACYLAGVGNHEFEILAAVFSFGDPSPQQSGSALARDVFHIIFSSFFKAVNVASGASLQKFPYCAILSAAPGVSLITRMHT